MGVGGIDNCSCGLGFGVGKLVMLWMAWVGSRHDTDA